MVTSLRHKRSAAILNSLPFPTSSSTSISNAPNDVRWNGDSLGPRDGYSGLFTSGLLGPPVHISSPPLYSYPFPPHQLSTSRRTTSARGTPPKVLLSKASPRRTPTHRRRSSIITTSPSTRTDHVEQTLNKLVQNLKVASPQRPGLPCPMYESRWSFSSEGSVGDSDSISFRKSRKSSETASAKSRPSVKSRKSEDTDRMEIEGGIPPVPVPLTPGRSLRMVKTVAKRLGLTSRKDRLGPPSMPAPTYRLPVPPIPNLSERVLPKKSSMSTLRLALTRKSSTNTLRSTRSSTHLPCGMTHHYDVPPLPLHLPPPQPRWRDANLPTINLHDADRSAGFLPSTMLSKNFRPPKTSIGQPRIQPSKSPSAFLEYIPRRAPGMPKKENPLPALPSSDDARPLPLPDLVHISENMTMDSEDLDTPDSTIVANCEALSESLSLQASRAETALKPERLLSVLRRQHKDLHGSQTPPVAGRRANKPTGDVSALLDKVPAPTIRSSNGRCPVETRLGSCYGSILLNPYPGKRETMPL
ncbi:MAG: hypothetical protein TREMPRED_005118 [Tremellales sp. Tagirdzhanova-0007]|nr:MAG: hypothetical protein TREMPRED_005118 [Tremellales sp. Tagirdzhanova-0007]